MAKKLVVEGWTDHPLKRGPNKGVIDSAEPKYNYLHTRVCAACRHRSCTAKKGYYTGLRGQCEKATPLCEFEEDKLCEALGAPKVPTWLIGEGAPPGLGEAYEARKKAIELYLYERWLKCREVTITVEEGHRG
jgi:hypothetical protein